MACTCTCYKEDVPYPCDCPCPEGKDATTSYTKEALDKAKAEKAALDARTVEYEKGVKEIKELSDKITDKEIDYIKTIYDAYPDGIPEDILATLEDRYGKEVISKMIDLFSETTLATLPAVTESFLVNGKTITATNRAPSSSRDLVEPDDVFSASWIQCRGSAVAGGYPLDGHQCCSAHYMEFPDYGTFSQWIGDYISIFYIYDASAPSGFAQPTLQHFSMIDAINACASQCCQPVYDDCKGLVFYVTAQQQETANPVTGIGQQDGYISVNITWIDYPNATVDVQLINANSGTVLQTIYDVTLPANNVTFSNLSAGDYAITLPGNFEIQGNNITDPIVYIQDCTERVFFPIDLPGCMDPNACNYNPEATVDNNSCLFDDCAGICGGEAYLDNCEDCVGGTTGADPCEEDCAGVWGGTYQIDECRECLDPLGNLWNQSCTDCAGTVNGPHLIDICGNCVDPNNPTLWNAECTGCLDKCAINYDPTAIQGCNDCCLHLDFKANCPCSATGGTSSITVYWFHPQGTDGTLTGGTITYGDTVVTIPNESAYIADQTSDGQYYSYLNFDLGTTPTDGIYTLKYDSVTAVDGAGNPLTPANGIQVKKCDMVLCNIEYSLQKYMKDIILANKCCDCDKLKDTYYKAWTLYRALKITATCGIDAQVTDTITQINSLLKEMKNSICNKC